MCKPKESTNKTKESTKDPKELTTEPQDSKELMLVLTDNSPPVTWPPNPPPAGSRVLTNYCDEDVDKIVLAVLKKLEKEHYIEMKAYLLVKEMIGATMSEELGSDDSKETIDSRNGERGIPRVISRARSKLTRSKRIEDDSQSVLSENDYTFHSRMG